MRLIKPGILFVWLILFSLTYLSSNAQPLGGHPEEGLYCRFDKDRKAFKGLNLSNEQHQKIDPIILSFQKQRMTQILEIQELKITLRKLEISDKPNQNEINRVIDEIGKKKVELQKSKSKLKQDIRNELTEEQRIRFDTRGDKPPGVKKSKGNRQIRKGLKR